MENGKGSTKFATKFTTKLVRSVRLITSAATDHSWIRFMFAAALPRRLRLFDAHDPDYVGVGRGVCSACRGVDCGEWNRRGVVVAADGGLVGCKVHRMGVGRRTAGAARGGVAAQKFVVAVEVGDDLAVVDAGCVGQGLAVALDELSWKARRVGEGLVPGYYTSDGHDSDCINDVRCISEP